MKLIVNRAGTLPGGTALVSLVPGGGLGVPELVGFPGCPTVLAVLLVGWACGWLLYVPPRDGWKKPPPWRGPPHPVTPATPAGGPPDKPKWWKILVALGVGALTVGVTSTVVYGHPGWIFTHPGTVLVDLAGWWSNLSGGSPRGAPTTTVAAPTPGGVGVTTVVTTAVAAGVVDLLGSPGVVTPVVADAVGVGPPPGWVTTQINEGLTRGLSPSPRYGLPGVPREYLGFLLEGTTSPGVRVHLATREVTAQFVNSISRQVDPDFIARAFTAEGLVPPPAEGVTTVIDRFNTYFKLRGPHLAGYFVSHGGDPHQVHEWARIAARAYVWHHKLTPLEGDHLARFWLAQVDHLVTSRYVVDFPGVPDSTGVKGRLLHNLRGYWVQNWSPLLDYLDGKGTVCRGKMSPTHVDLVIEGKSNAWMTQELKKLQENHPELFLPRG